MICYYYWLVEPLRKTFQNTSEDTPIFEVPIKYICSKITDHERECKVAVFVDETGLPFYVRLEIPQLEREEIPENLLPLIQTTKEHMLSVLRLTYHSNAGFFPRPFWAFVKDGTPFSIGLEFSEVAGKFSFDAERVRRVFIGSFGHRIDIKLLADGLDQHVPLQYRYLSLYKILERRFKTKGRWQKEALESFLTQFETDFKNIGVTKKPSSYVHELRDRCAHIKTNREVEGVTHLNLQEAAKVETALPVIMKACINSINETAEGKFQIGYVKQNINRNLGVKSSGI